MRSASAGPHIAGPHTNHATQYRIYALYTFRILLAMSAMAYDSVCAKRRVVNFWRSNLEKNQSKRHNVPYFRLYVISAV